MGRSHSVGILPLQEARVASAPERYSLAIILLHWLMAALLLAQIAIGLHMVDLPKKTPDVAYYYNLHKSLGLVALLLVAVRLWWRARAGAPAAAGLHVSDLQQKLATSAHRLLYVCMVVIPLAGFAGSNFGKHPVRFFGYALPQFGWDSPVLQAFFRQLHAAFVWLLCALLVLHLLAVAYHLLRSGTGILQRMLPPGSQ